MKFGDYLKANSLQCWKSDYINYDLLKGFIKQHPDWQDEHQYEFIRLMTQEYHRITDLIDQHTLELRNRIHRDNWVDILLDIYDFSRFVQLNQTGFEKMIKKHKKYTQRSIDLVFILVFDDVSLYTSLRQSDDGEKKPASSTQLLTSKKYWLDHIHVPQVVANLCMHMLVDYHSNLSNFYMDNARMECYLDRLDDKDDSEMIKFKRYV
jgi:SPX domain protein involved in polyphosphate accumulation